MKKLLSLFAVTLFAVSVMAQTKGGAVAPIDGVYTDVTETYLIEKDHFSRPDDDPNGRFGSTLYWTVENYEFDEGGSIKNGIDNYPGYNCLQLGSWESRPDDPNLENSRLYRKVTLPAGKYFFGAKYNSLNTWDYSDTDKGFLFVSETLMNTSEVETNALAYCTLASSGLGDRYFNGVTFALAEEKEVYLGWQVDSRPNYSEFRASAVTLMAIPEGSVKEALTTGGWQKLEGITADFDYSKKYFALVDRTQDLALVSVKRTNGDGYGHWGNVYSMNYSSVYGDDALFTFDAFDADKNWITDEGTAARIIMTGYQDPDRHFRTEGWNHDLWQTFTDRNAGYDSDRDRKRVFMMPEYAEETGWTFKNEETDRYLSLWGEQGYVSGAYLYANKGVESASHFDVYYIDRVEWMQKKVNWEAEAENGPVDITKLLTNASFERFDESYHPLGWTVEGEGVVETGYMSGCTGGVYINNWQGEGTLSDRSIAQTVKGLPAGKYRMVVQRVNNGNGAYLYANDAKAEISQGNSTEDFSMDFKLTEEATDVTLGVKLEGFTANDLKYDNIRLYYLGKSAAKVGGATVSASVIQPGDTVTVSYDGAFTEDEESLAFGTGIITFGGNEIEIIPTENGFTFAVPADIVAGEEYVLSIPENTIGYATSGIYNTAEAFTFTAPVVFDGVYYLKNNDAEKAATPYFGRGYSYGTGAHLSEYGVAVKFETDEKGTHLIFADSKLQLKDNGYMWTDDFGSRYFTVEKTENGYMFKNPNNGLYITDWENRIVGDGPADRASACWSLVTVADYIAEIKAKDVAKSIDAAGLAGIVAEDIATIAAELDKLWDATEIEVDEESKSLKQSWQQNCSGNEDGAHYNIMNKTVENLPAGLYKVAVQAWERATHLADVQEADGIRGDAFIDVNGTKVNLMGLLEEELESYPEHGDDKSVDSIFAEGKYLHEIYVYLNEPGSINYKVTIPSRYGNDGERGRWIAFKNFTITHYDNTPECLKVYEATVADVAKADWAVETIFSAETINEAAELLGAAPAELTFQLVDTLGVTSEYNGNPGEVLFWVDLDGNKSNWGVNNKFFISYNAATPAITTTQYGVSEGDVLNAKVRLANAKGDWVEFVITESIYKNPVTTPADYEIVGTYDVTFDYTIESGEVTAEFADAEIAALLGVESFTYMDILTTDAEGNISFDHTANTGYWMTAEGTPCKWGTEGMCYFIEYRGFGTGLLHLGDGAAFEPNSTLTNTFYVVSEGNAVQVNITINVNKATGIDGISAEDVVKTQYFGINGSAIDAPSKGINIVKQTLKNGKVVTSKVYVK